LIGIEGAIGAIATRYLARNLAWQVGNFEFLDAVDAALTGEQSLPCGLDAASQRRQHAKTSDDNASHHRRFPLTTSADVASLKPAVAALTRAKRPTGFAPERAIVAAHPGDAEPRISSSRSFREI
jgi:hypothetical protein